MTVEFLQKIFNTQTMDVKELLSFANELLDNKKIELSVYATLKVNINKLNPIKKVEIFRDRASRYTEDEILTVLKSHLEVYDGLKDIQSHLNYMKQLLGETSSQYRNGAQYNKSFHKTLDKADANLGQSMPANWADATLLLVKDRELQFKNVLSACKDIYESTNNGNMYKVIQKWSK